MSPLDFDPAIRIVVFALYCLVAVVMIVFLVFYAPHVTGHVLARTLTWVLRRRYGGELSIGALKVNPLGGRILFRRLRWVTRDYSIHIEGGYLGFRWWRLEARPLDHVRIDRDIAMGADLGAGPPSDGDTGARS